MGGAEAEVMPTQRWRKVLCTYLPAFEALILQRPVINELTINPCVCPGNEGELDVELTLPGTVLL